MFQVARRRVDTWGRIRVQSHRWHVSAWNDMQLALRERSPGAPARSISLFRELGAYECLWDEPGASFKRLAERFRAHPDFLPSDFVDPDRAAEMARRVLNLLSDHGVARFGVRLHRAGEYPPRLRDAHNLVELLYFKGWWNLVETRCVAVVGTRHPSEEGRQRARSLVKDLVASGYTVVSGLAAGIDTEAHRTALDAGGRTIAVLGTPLSETYPPGNAALQWEIAETFLVVSQVPVARYYRQGWRDNRAFFRERNVTMSALTDATWPAGRAVNFIWCARPSFSLVKSTSKAGVSSFPFQLKARRNCSLSSPFLSHFASRLDAM